MLPLPLQVAMRAGQRGVRIQLLCDHYMSINGTQLRTYVLRIVGQESGQTSEVCTHQTQVTQHTKPTHKLVLYSLYYPARPRSSSSWMSGLSFVGYMRLKRTTSVFPTGLQLLNAPSWLTLPAFGTFSPLTRIVLGLGTSSFWFSIPS